MPTTSTTTPWVDLLHLQALADGLEPTEAYDILVRLHAAVKSDFAILRKAIGEACGSEQTQALATGVHALKGCVLLLGWKRMGERCAETLAVLREDRFTRWKSLPGEIDFLYQSSEADLLRVMNDLAVSGKSGGGNLPRANAVSADALAAVSRPTSAAISS